MSDLKFSDLKELADILCDPYFIPANSKIKVSDLLVDVLKFKGIACPQDAIAAFQHELQVNLRRELTSEMKRKIDTFAQLELEKKDLQTRKVEVDRLNRTLQHEKNTTEKENTMLKAKLKDVKCEAEKAKLVLRAELENARNGVEENIELRDKLNVQIRQLQQNVKLLEVNNDATEYQRKRSTYIALASTGLAVGLAVYVARF